MQKDVCPAYAAFRQRKRAPILSTLKRRLDTYSCRRAYADARDPENPFASPGE